MNLDFWKKWLFCLLSNHWTRLIKIRFYLETWNCCPSLQISPFLWKTVWIRPLCLLCFLAEEIIFVTQRELPGHTKKYENSPCKEFNGLGVYVRGPSVRKLETDMFSLISWRQVRFCWRVGTDRPHQHSFQSTWWDEHVSLRKLVKDMMLLVSFHSDLFIALTKETAVSRKEILHDSNKKIWIWSLDWKSSLYQKKQKTKNNSYIT